MRKRCVRVLAWLAVLGLPSLAKAQKMGPEFQVNTYTTGEQRDPAVASDASGNLVVVWNSFFGQDGSNYGVFGQRYDSEGSPLGDEFQVNSYTNYGQKNQSVTSDATGNFVVVWQSDHQDDGFNYGIYAQRYDSGGSPLGGEFGVNSFRPGPQTGPAVVSAPNGNFVVVWESYNQGSHRAIFGQRYDNGGNRLGGEFQVTTYTTFTQYHPSVASDARGNFVVVWQSDGHDGDGQGVFGQRYDSNGNRLGTEFQVNTYTTSDQALASVASDSAGNVVVVWRSRIQDGSASGIFGQRYDSSGSPLGGEFKVNTYTARSQHFPSVSSDASSNFVVVWRSFDQDGSYAGIFGQRYDSDGKRVGGEFRVNTYTTDIQRSPSVASDSRGNFVVVWESRYQDGSGFGVFGQRFSGACEASWQCREAVTNSR